VSIPHSDDERMVQALARQAETYLPEAKEYFTSILYRSNLPSDWIGPVIASLRGVPRDDAWKIVRFAKSKGGNRNDPRYTTLGSILTALLEDQGVEDRDATAAIIIHYSLYRDRALLASLAERFQIPVPAPPGNEQEEFPAPILSWDKSADVELQGLLQRSSMNFDVGYLINAVQRSASICRVESSLGPHGTGFLVSPQAVLTSCHVASMAPGADLVEKARNLSLRFRCIAAGTAGEAVGQVFRLDQHKPVYQSSPIDKLDYVLLFVEEGVAAASDLKPIDILHPAPVTKGTICSILHHPGGKNMQLTFSANGVTKVHDSSGRLQYVAQTARGSSGAPCFDEQWRPIALHCSLRARPTGAVGEGVLLTKIMDELGSIT
jgi:V8-like Glu-specific endopeptidase